MNIFTVPKTRNLIFVAITVAAMAATMAQAQQVDTSAWECEFCPFESGNRADYQLGASSVSDDAAYLGDASGYSEEGVYANVDGEGSYASEGHQLRWSVEDLGLDSRYAELAGGRQGTFDYNLSYREIPRTQFFTTISSGTVAFYKSADVIWRQGASVFLPTTAGRNRRASTSLAARISFNQASWPGRSTT